MTVMAMIPLIHASHHGDVAANVYITGVVVVCGLGVLVMIGYLVIDAKPDSDTALSILLLAAGGGILLPVVIVVLPVVGLVLGLRWMIHGPRPSLSRESRRDARIRRMEQRTAELEKELKL